MPAKAYLTVYIYYRLSYMVTNCLERFFELEHRFLTIKYECANLPNGGNGLIDVNET
jgi:hypothetical protein